MLQLIKSDHIRNTYSKFRSIHIVWIPLPWVHKSMSCFSKVSRVRQNILPKFVYCKYRTFCGNFKLKILYACTKPYLGYTYKISAWNFSRKHKLKYVQIHSHDPADFRSFYDELSARFQAVSLNPDLCANPNDNYELFESLNRLCWTPSPNILLQKLLDLKSTNIGFPRGSLMVFCVPSNIEINCFGKYDAFQIEQTSIHHCR